MLNVFEEFEVVGGEGGRVSSEGRYDETDFPESVVQSELRAADRPVLVSTHE